MKRTVPEYLYDAGNLAVTIIATALSVIAFMAASALITDLVWFDLHESSRFIYTIGFFCTVIIIVIASKALLYRKCKRRPLPAWQYVLWNILEILVIAAIYAAANALLKRPASHESFTGTYLKAVPATAAVLSIPYGAVFAMVSARARNRIKHGTDRDAQTDADEELIPEGLRKAGNTLVPITDNGGNLKLSISMDNLLYIESDDNYIKVHYTTHGKLQSYLIRCKMKTIEEKFSSGKRLVRCHRSYIVNIGKVRILRKEMNNYFIELDNKETPPIPVSKKYFESFSASLKSE